MVLDASFTQGKENCVFIIGKVVRAMPRYKRREEQDSSGMSRFLHKPDLSEEGDF